MRVGRTILEEDTVTEQERVAPPTRVQEASCNGPVKFVPFQRPQLARDVRQREEDFLRILYIRRIVPFYTIFINVLDFVLTCNVAK